MSRITKKPLLISEDVSIKIVKQEIHIKGRYGTLIKKFSSNISFSLENNYLYITNIFDNYKNSKSYHSLVKILIKNMIYGVSNNYTKILILQGIGFKFQLTEDLLIINVGYTHSIKIIIPNYLRVTLDSPTIIKINGIDKEQVSLFASIIYNIKPPEPYKGKGIFYENQQISKKAGKIRR